MSELPFNAIDFGHSDADTEFREARNLLRRGYYDLNNVEDRLLRAHKFIVLGYKGAGKSMIGARFRVLAEDTPTLYSCPAPVSVSELALADLRRIVPDAFDARARAMWSWALFMLVKLLEMVEGDGEAERESRALVGEACQILRSHKVISSSPRSLAKFKTTRMETKIQVAKVLEQTWHFDQSTSDQTLNVWLAYLLTILSVFKSRRKHFLFVDGLDDLGPIVDNNAILLGGLFAAARHVNTRLAEEHAPLKVVLCCRTDVYERLDLAQKGRLRASYAIELDWYQDPREVGRTHLAQLASQRATMAGGGRPVSVFDRYFPARIDNRPAISFLASNTRHTPRDFLALLRHIQDMSASSDVGTLARETILSGARNYSRVYFRDEMDDALDSYFPAGTKRSILDAVGRLRRHRFTLAEFDLALKARKANVSADEALEALFECCFVGTESSMGGDRYYRFLHRNPAARVATSDSFELHPGLWKAYDLV